MRGSRLLVALGSSTLLVGTALPANAYPVVAGPPVPASGASPFAGCPVGAAPGDDPGTVYPNTEVEPFVAVNPTDPDNVIGVFQQDRWSTGGSHGLVASRSTNGGQSWTESYAPFSECSGGDPVYDRASDPWVTFDAAGDAYQISLSISADQATSAVLVSKSTDQGATWGPPATLIRDDTAAGFNDKETITGDPTRPGYVYAVWDRISGPSGLPSQPIDLPSLLAHGVPLFSRTTDGGATWSTPVPMADGLLGTLGNQIAVLPNGTLVNVFFGYRFAGRLPFPNPLFVGVMVSTDAGEHWSRPIQVSDYVPAVGCDAEVCDPGTGEPVRAGTNVPDIAVDPTSGRMYVVWADGRFSGGRTDVALSTSANGTDWTTPVKVNQTPAPVSAFNATVDVSSDGTVGVLYYDFRQDTPAPSLPTSVLLAHSHDAGATWSEQPISEAFDMQNAPDARGLFLGDYQGLDNIGRDFLAFFSRSGAADNSADVVAVRVGAP